MNDTMFNVKNRSTKNANQQNSVFLKNIRINIIHLFILLFFITLNAQSISKSNNVPQKNQITIALDIGHTPNQPGAMSAYGESEYTYNKNFVHSLKNELYDKGFNVVIINPQGAEISLDERNQLAKNQQANILISIHHDSVQAKYLSDWQVNGKTYKMSNYARGFGVFVSRENMYWQQSLTCATKIGKAFTSVGLQASEHHAVPEIGENRPWADKKNGVYFFDGLRVLRTAEIPALLIEVGVITHPDEAKALQNKRHQKTQAQAIAQALADCLK